MVVWAFPVAADAEWLLADGARQLHRWPPTWLRALKLAQGSGYWKSADRESGEDVKLIGGTGRITRETFFYRNKTGEGAIGRTDGCSVLNCISNIFFHSSTPSTPGITLMAHINYPGLLTWTCGNKEGAITGGDTGEPSLNQVVETSAKQLCHWHNWYSYEQELRLLVEEPRTATTAWHHLLMLAPRCCGTASHSSTSMWSLWHTKAEPSSVQ